MTPPSKVTPAEIPRAVWVRVVIYACFFLTGATSLVFEVIWSCQFVTVFGNSSYAVSVVLCAYMTGLGLGGLTGGKWADRIRRRIILFGLIQVGVSVWALAMPFFLNWFRSIAPALAVSPESLAVSTLSRFVWSFAVLALPCFSMGMTLPLLVREVADSNCFIGRRIGALYCWNSLGAAFGCMAAGFWMLDTLGLRLTNLLAVGTNVLVALAAFALSKRLSADMETTHSTEQSTPGCQPIEFENQETAVRVPGQLLLSVAFLNGIASLSCEVLWMRHLAFLLFLGRPAYVFSLILCIYLLGLGIGGLVYSLLAARTPLSAMALAKIQLILGISVLATFAFGATVFSAGPPPPLSVEGMAVITVFLPAVLMGMAFPLLCKLYGQRVQKLGQRVGLLFAINTAGSVLGSLLPVFVLIPFLGIQRSVLIVSLLFGGTGMVLIAWGRKAPSLRSCVAVLGAYGVSALLFVTVVPSNLCQRMFLATDFNLARNSDILFYREGRTGTATVTRDRVNHRKLVYINGNPEVPALYAHQLCFKLLGDLGPMLHPDPENVLMICFGGGIAAGATACLPEVKSLTIVDLESSVVEAAKLLAVENNNVLQNPKTHVVIDDGRNYILTSRRKWPVVITDSTHPKAPDSWVLYSQEFYRNVRGHLTEDGVFVQWVPFHDLSTAEYKIILRTFQSVFPHASLWISAGMDERGQFITYSILVGTVKPLNINVAQLRSRLDAAPVRQDLEPYGMNTVAGFLDMFLCAEDTMRHWVGDGPINTDDLPYTYYITDYAKRKKMGFGQFIELMEDLWPRLTDTGSEESAGQLHQELRARAQANRLAFSGRISEALATFPQDPRYRQMRQLYDEGPAYMTTLASSCWDDPKALVYAASLGAPGLETSQTAEQIYERVLKLDPNNVDALTMLGCIRADMGDMAKAENCLSRAVQLRPQSANVQYNLANLLFKKGSVDAAIVHYRRALESQPDYADAENNLGNTFLHKGNLDDAMVHWRNALQINPDLPEACFNLANALEQKQRLDEAIVYYQKAVEIKPNDPEAQNALAWIFATGPQPSLRNGHKAVELAEKANQLTGGEVPPVLRTLAAAYAEVGRFDDAMRCIAKGIALARAAGREDMAGALNDELTLYKAGRPLRLENN